MGVILRALRLLPKAYHEQGRLDVWEMADWLRAELEHDGYSVTMREAISIVNVFYTTVDELSAPGSDRDESERPY